MSCLVATGCQDQVSAGVETDGVDRTWMALVLEKTSTSLNAPYACSMVCKRWTATDNDSQSCISCSILSYFIFKALTIIWLSIHLSMAVQPFVGPWPLFQFLDLFTELVGLLGRGISPSQGHYWHTGQDKHRINAHRHPCLKRESNQWSQCFGGQRQFMP
jgi:hypothetical protein